LRPLLARIVAQLGGADMLMQRLAGSVFLLRAASALLPYVPQVLLARWMGGIYVYMWTWMLLPARLLARAAIGLDRDAYCDDLGVARSSGAAARSVGPPVDALSAGERRCCAGLRGRACAPQWQALIDERFFLS